MAEENYPAAPTEGGTLNNTTGPEPINIDSSGKEWLTPEDTQRLNDYEFYEHLFFGRHFQAFSIKMQSDTFGKEYAKLKYIVANFPGLISKIIADFLFIEPPKFKAPEGGDQKFLDALIKANKLRVVNYESALNNSYLGDTLYKLRVGKRNFNDKATVIIEEITPKIYFPQISPFNVKAKPQREDLAWKIKHLEKDYVFKEIYQDGKIYHKAFLLEDNKLTREVSLAELGLGNVKPVEDTRIGASLIEHIPNWRAGNRYFGLSDYYDLETLFFGINNRMTKVGSILDKHSDPILMVPPGILDENGKVKRQHLGMIEKAEGEDNDPAYITWDANLESAFKEIEKLVEMTFMMSETAPDILGMGKGGQSDSGRALKYKLLRTIAKAQRKQLYYSEGLVEVLYKAQLLAKEMGLEVEGLKLQGEAVRPNIEWQDGLPKDMVEMVEIESTRIDAGLSSKKDSIMRLDDIEEDAAEAKVKEIREENELDMPPMTPATIKPSNTPTVPPKAQGGK